MARKRRICLPETTCHASSRCIEKKPLMKPDKMKDLMLHVIKLSLLKYNYEMIEYAIMDNHFHFYIRTLNNGESISRIMQFIKSQFARRYNRLMNRTGPFWNERFSDTIIELTENPEQTFWYIFMYIAYNPVRSKYVKDPRDYLYCSFRSYVDDRYISPVPITIHGYFMKLGNSFRERIEKFLGFEELYRKRLFAEGIF